MKPKAWQKLWFRLDWYFLFLFMAMHESGNGEGKSCPTSRLLSKKLVFSESNTYIKVQSASRSFKQDKLHTLSWGVYDWGVHDSELNS